MPDRAPDRSPSERPPIAASDAPDQSPDSQVRPWHGVAHYENFPVASWLVPSAKRPAVAALYRFARYADDVADEGDASPQQRLEELDALDVALGDPATRHPVVAGLLDRLGGQTEATTDCRALLSAFRQDITVTRYPSYAALLDYCSRSASPVGRLMLGLFDCRQAALLPASDAICNALQLINFLQDMAIDWSRGRLYMPLDELAAAGLTEQHIEKAAQDRRADASLRHLIEAQAHRCLALLESGAPLVKRVPWRLGLELRGVLAGGRRIVERLAQEGFDPFAQRPKLGAADLPALLRLAVSRPRLPMTGAAPPAAGPHP